MSRHRHHAGLDALRTQPHRPEAIRRRVLEVVSEVSEGHRAIYFSLALLDDDCHFVGALSNDPDTQAALDDAVEGKPASPAMLDGGARAAQLPQFATARVGAPLPVGDDPLHLAVYKRHQVTDHARILVYDDRRFVGWLGVLRSDGHSFDGEPVDRLGQLAPDVALLLVEADRAERASFEPQPRLVVGVDGEVILSSTSAERWLTPRRRELIGVAIRSAARDGTAQGARLVAFAEARFERLFGATAAYLVTLCAPVAPLLEPGALLTQRQREIALHAVAGLTRGEIALLLSVSEETVRHHLKLVYERLGVGSRVELANVLRAEP